MGRLQSNRGINLRTAAGEKEGAYRASLMEVESGEYKKESEEEILAYKTAGIQRRSQNIEGALSMLGAAVDRKESLKVSEEAGDYAGKESYVQGGGKAEDWEGLDKSEKGKFLPKQTYGEHDILGMLNPFKKADEGEGVLGIDWQGFGVEGEGFKGSWREAGERFDVMTGGEAEYDVGGKTVKKSKLEADYETKTERNMLEGVYEKLGMNKPPTSAISKDDGNGEQKKDDVEIPSVTKSGSEQEFYTTDLTGKVIKDVNQDKQADNPPLGDINLLDEVNLTDENVITGGNKSGVIEKGGKYTGTIEGQSIWQMTSAEIKKLSKQQVIDLVGGNEFFAGLFLTDANK